MRNSKQKNYSKKYASRSEDLKIAIAKDCLFSPLTKVELEDKWKVNYCCIQRHTKKYNFEYFKKLNRKDQLLNIK
jgi:hypothetical protein